MNNAQELLAAVRARTEGTPYVLTETEDGFEVRIDVEDASWSALMYEQHVSMVWTYAVKVDEATKTLSITDIVQAVDWRVGSDVRDGVPVPVLSISTSKSSGRSAHKSFRNTYAVNEQGEYAQTVDFRFDAAEGRDLIRGPSRELGWTEKRGVHERIGLYVAATTIVLLVLSGIVVAILTLLGLFSSTS